MSRAAVIDFQGVSKAFPIDWLGRRLLPALSEVSFSIEPGEVFGLVGPNRAGKSTLVKILLSLCRPTTGQVFRLGRPIADRSTLAHVGFMHENQAFPRYWNARGLLQFYGALALLPEPQVHSRVDHLLELVGLSNRCQEPIARFSKGMVQRLALAQALINDPQLLVLDEPTESLDLAGRELLFEVIQERQRRGATVLVVSHVLADIERHCNRVAVLVNGRLIYVGPTNALTRDAQTGTVRSLEQAVKGLYEGLAA
jgi:ABC-2 type transport system ATP-binding protein